MATPFDKLQYRVLTEDETTHHVMLCVLGTPWMQTVATFRDRGRARSYAEIEADMLADKTASLASDWEPIGQAERVDPPAIIVPPSAVIIENFRPAGASMASEYSADYSAHDHPQMLDARVATPAVPVRSGSAPAVDSAAGSAGEEIPAPTPSGSPADSSPAAHPTQVANHATPPVTESKAGTKAPGPSNRDASAGEEPSPKAGPQAEAFHAGTGTGTPAVREGHSPERERPRRPIAAVESVDQAAPVRPASNVSEPPRPKPVTSSLPTTRDPSLSRPVDVIPARESLPADQHPGSAAQQLADRIVEDMPALMKDHPRGPIRADLAARYAVPPARVNEAVIYLFAHRKIRLERFDGTEQHIVPPEFDLPVSPAPRPASPGMGIAKRHEAALLDVLRVRARDGLVRGVRLAALANDADVPMGSMGAAISALVRAGSISIETKADGKVPAAFRILSPTP